MAHGSQQKLCLSPHQCVCPFGLPHCIRPPQSDSVLSLCLGLDMEERTRQMKLKMNKYKQVAGSDSRLEQDYHKVKKTTKRTKHTSRYCECMLRYPPCTVNIYLRYTVCMVALGIGHMAHFAGSQACTHALISIIRRMFAQSTYWTGAE